MTLEIIDTENPLAESYFQEPRIRVSMSLLKHTEFGVGSVLHELAHLLFWNLYGECYTDDMQQNHILELKCDLVAMYCMYRCGIEPQWYLLQAAKMFQERSHASLTHPYKWDRVSILRNVMRSFA